MKWKKGSDLIVVILFSIAYTIVTLLNIIGPLHINHTGAINSVGMLTVYSILYWIVALSVSWLLYFYLKNSKILFFTLVIVGIAFIIAEVFLWGLVGS